MSNRAQPDLFAPGVAEAPAFALVPSPAAPPGVRQRLADVDGLDEGDTLRRSSWPAASRRAFPMWPAAADALLARFGGVGPGFRGAARARPCAG